MSALLAIGLVALIQPAVAPQTAAVSGLVLEEGSRAPIAGAQVTLIPARPPAARFPFSNDLPTAITDQNGRYEIDSLEPGRYRIQVHKSGFAFARDGNAAEIQLEPGQRRDVRTVTLQKGAVIAGRVLDEAGEPVTNVRVTAMSKPPVFPRAGSRRPDFLIPAGPATETNDLGEFRLFGLAAGEYYVQAATPDRGFMGAANVPQSRTMLPTYFPGTSSSAAAQGINIAAGETAGDLVIRMVTVPAFRVAGVVRDDAGRPVVNALVKLVDLEPQGPANFPGLSLQTRTDTAGRFTINNVTNGRYTLMAIAPVLIASGNSSSSSSWGSGISGSVSGGSVGGQVMTETHGGTTIQYRDDRATRVAITVSEAAVENLEIVVRPPKPE